MYNISDIDYFKFTDSSLKFGDNVTFKIHYYGSRENPFGYKWATFCGTNMVGGGSLLSQDQECKALVSSGNTVYLEVYYDQSRSQYFNYGEEFVAEMYVNGVRVGNDTTEPDGKAYIDGIYYNFTEENAEVISGSNAYSGAVFIPASITYKGKIYNVISIGTDAFANCTGLTSITIPPSLKGIGENAFYNCTGLKKVIVSDIAGWCGISFSGNEANPLTKANHLFSNASTEIKNLVIPNGVTSIGSYAFRYCTGLTSVTIPNSVTSIGDFSFDGCSGLTSITIPNSVTRIGNAALWGCSSLTSISIPIPNSVTEIGYKAFEKCSGITSITIPSSVISIGEHAFRYCSALKKVIVPDIAAWCGISFSNYQANPLSTAQHLFSDESTEIKDLVIPYGVNINKFVFSGCSGLTSVTIPNSVTNIGEEAFTNCSGLTTITIPNSVTSIDRYAFKYCSGLTYVTIPESVTSIGDASFWSCGLTDVYCHAKIVPSTNSNAFYNSPIASATLHIPTGSIDLYKTTSPWSNFGTIISFETDDFLALYDSLLWTAKRELAAARGIKEVIQSVSQLSSPYTESSEGSLAALLDGNINTFWHSNWKNGNVAGGIHYLQVDLLEHVDTKMYVSFTRRPTENDHVTNMSVMGSNNPNASKTICKNLLTFSCPYTSNTETITSPTFDTKGYRYLRFYANETNSNRGFWHISEFQLYSVAPASETLVIYMDGEDERLQAIIDEQAKLRLDQIGEAEYNALKEAYDAFMVKLAEIVDGIENVSDGNINPASTSIYNPNGLHISSPQKGINIIRYPDGTSKKFLLK